MRVHVGLRDWGLSVGCVYFTCMLRVLYVYVACTFACTLRVGCVYFTCMLLVLYVYIACTLRGNLKRPLSVKIHPLSVSVSVFRQRLSEVEIRVALEFGEAE